MTDFTHDTADDGFHEIQLSGKQLVFLFMVTTVVIVVVFLCGVQVGRGVAARAAPPSKAPDPGGCWRPRRSAANARAAAGDRRNAGGRSRRARRTKRLRREARYSQTSGSPPRQMRSWRHTENSAGRRTGAHLRPALNVRQRRRGQRRRPNPAVCRVKPRRHLGGPGHRHSAIAQWPPPSSSACAAKGYPAFLVSPPAGSAGQNYKVHVGRFDDRARSRTGSPAGSRRKNSSSPGLFASDSVGRAARAQLPEVRPSRLRLAGPDAARRRARPLAARPRRTARSSSACSPARCISPALSTGSSRR